MAYNEFTLDRVRRDFALEVNEQANLFGDIHNEREGQGPTTIHGAVTTGTNWRFLKLESSNLLVSRHEYFFEPVGRILAMLLHCAGGDPATAGAAA